MVERNHNAVHGFVGLVTLRHGGARVPESRRRDRERTGYANGTWQMLGMRMTFRSPREDLGLAHQLRLPPAPRVSVPAKPPRLVVSRSMSIVRRPRLGLREDVASFSSPSLLLHREDRRDGPEAFSSQVQVPHHDGIPDMALKSP